MELQTLLLCLCAFIVALAGHWLAGAVLWGLSLKLYLSGYDKPKKRNIQVDDDPFEEMPLRPSPPPPPPAPHNPGYTIVRR